MIPPDSGETVEAREANWLEGHRFAWVEIFRKARSEIGYTEEQNLVNNLIIEREEAIVQLRELCREFGDNDWKNDLNLADVIEKHLGRYILRKQT